MGLLSKLFQRKNQKKLSSDVTFAPPAIEEKTSLRNQNEEITDFSRPELDDFLQVMFDDREQFIVFSLPEAPHGIYFVQAAQVADGIDVQLGLAENGRTRVVTKICTSEVCREIFYEFFETGDVSERSGYKPLEFYV